MGARLGFAGLLVAALLFGCGPGTTLTPTTPTESDPYVRFPSGDCSTGMLEIEVDGAPHPQFPQVAVESCLRMSVAQATGSLRVRCIDPNGASEPSDWVGPAQDSMDDASLCANKLN